MKILMIKDMKVHHILRIKHYYSSHFAMHTSYSDGHFRMVFIVFDQVNTGILL
jgi:hypothetical protein